MTLTISGQSDLDTGWTGISHNQGVVEGTNLYVCLEGCDRSTNSICTGVGRTGRDTINGPVFGAPLPLSTGGAPVCVVNAFKGDLTLFKADLATGQVNIDIPLESRVHGPSPSQSRPCPTCSGETIGARGVCRGGPNDGRSCVTGGTSQFGNVSADCPPPPADNIGNLDIDLNSTTCTQTLTATIPCSGGTCWCERQQQMNDCDSPASCSESICPSGQLPGIDQTCCRKSGQVRACFIAPDITRSGNGCVPLPEWPDPTYPKGAAGTKLASTFCIARTSSGLVNGIAGLAGPGALLLAGNVCHSMP
jgi:hypothetical protein